MFHSEVSQFDPECLPQAAVNVFYLLVALILDSVETLRAVTWLVEGGCEGWDFGCGTHP